MIIQEIIDQTLSADISALNFVDRYGGVVQTAVQETRDQNGKTIRKRYPVSCSVNQADCTTDQRYQDLVPNDTKSSVLYFEVTQGLQDQGAQKGNEKIRVMKGAVRLVCWLNNKKLALTGCNPASRPMVKLWSLIKGKRRIRANTDPLLKSTINLRVTGEEIKSPAIFAGYDYPLDNSYLFHPFDYFAINIDVEYITPMCDVTITVGPEVDCVDDSRI